MSRVVDYSDDVRYFENLCEREKALEKLMAALDF